MPVVPIHVRYLGSVGPKAEGDINLQRNARNCLIPKFFGVNRDQSVLNVVLQRFQGT